MYLKNQIVCQVLTGALCCSGFHDRFHRVETRLAGRKKNCGDREKKQFFADFEYTGLACLFTIFYAQASENGS